MHREASGTIATDPGVDPGVATGRMAPDGQGHLQNAACDSHAAGRTPRVSDAVMWPKG